MLPYLPTNLRKEKILALPLLISLLIPGELKILKNMAYEAFNIIFVHGGAVIAYPRTQVWLNLDTSNKEDLAYTELSKQLAKGEYRLLIKDTEKLYLFLYSNEEQIPLVEVPMSKVKAIKIHPRYK